MGNYLLIADAVLAERSRGQRDPDPVAVYSGIERDILADAPDGLRASIDAVKTTFGDWCGVELVEIRHDPHWPRRQAARLIRHARHEGDRDRAVCMRDGWRERLAICTIDGGLSETDAEAVAWQEISNT